MSLRIPKKGSVEWVALYDGVDRDEDPELDAAIESLGENDREIVLSRIPPDKSRAVSANKAFQGVDVAIIHVGPKQAKRWGYQAVGLQLEEKRRLAAARKGLKREQAPELFSENAMTPEAGQDQMSLAAEVFSAAIGGVRGVEGVPETIKTPDDRAAVAEFLEYLDLSEMILLTQTIIERQSVSAREFFCTPSVVDVAAG